MGLGRLMRLIPMPQVPVAWSAALPGSVTWKRITPSTATEALATVGAGCLAKSRTGSPIGSLAPVVPSARRH
jgi:hypothetical protein